MNESEEVALGADHVAVDVAQRPFAGSGGGVVLLGRDAEHDRLQVAHGGVVLTQGVLGAGQWRAGATAFGGQSYS